MKSRILLLFIIIASFLHGQNSVKQTDYTTSNADSTEAIETIEYKDVYGQTLQSNGIKFTPQKHDVVTQIHLDDYGRAFRSNLPIPTNQNSGVYAGNDALASIAQGYYGDNYGESQFYYSETTYEPTPLNRPLK